MASKEQIQRVLDYVRVFTTESGAKVLDDMRKSFCRGSFVPGDPYKTAFNEGRREVVLRIERMIEEASDPEFSALRAEQLIDEGE